MKIRQKELWQDRHNFIVSLINLNKINIDVEIGVAFGGNAENILLKTGIKKLYGIDPYKQRWTYNDIMNKKQKDFDLLYKDVLKRLNHFNKRYEHIRKYSKDAIDDINEEIDFIYIDGDHSYTGVLNDLRLWFPEIKNGGIMAGDDYSVKQFPGVKKSVDNFFKKLNLQINFEEPNIWWIKKEETNKKIRRMSYDYLFLFNPTFRKVHFFIGELNNATIGKIISYKNRKKGKFKIELLKILKKILPKKFFNYLIIFYKKRIRSLIS